MIKKIVFLLLLFPLNAFCLNRGELRTNARLLSRDTGSTRVRFTDSQINTLLDEAQDQITSRTNCVFKSFQFELVSYTTYYNLPSDFNNVRRVLRNKQVIPEMSPAALDARSREWEESSGVPTYYFLNFSSRTKIGFAPWPAVAADTGTVKVEYFADSAQMTSDSSVPFEGISEFYAFHPALSYYAAGIMTALDGKGTISTAFFTIYENYLKTLSTQCVDRPNYLPGAVGKQ